ncbi:hypothetical protein [Vibrio coralliilyticus]|uniref:IS3 family transposase n=1 Tax=Vibrio coralliilyticus TaxID=190893 RepID=A0AAP7DF09_9VIBR|nr:hypothetical protein [Vibrio coralliilyticus]
MREQGYIVARAALAIGVTTTALYKWKDRLESQLEGVELTYDERDELKWFCIEAKSYAWRKRP